MTNDSVLSAIADPTRRAILERVAARPRSVGELAGELPVSQPAVSQHLRVLREAGLVDLRREGARHIYSANADALAELRAYVESLWNDVLTSYARGSARKGERKRGGDR
jgi:DNA-binding transcriptional ArsR family regulator